jgi:hypothetical protein
MRTTSILCASLLSITALLGAAGCSDNKPVATATPNSEKATPGSAVSLSEIKVGNWGPQETIAGTPFNVQPTGKSAVWIQVTGLNISGGMQVLFGDKQLEDVSASDQIVTGAVPNALIEQPGDRSIVLIEGATNRKVTVGTFRVLPK